MQIAFFLLPFVLLGAAVVFVAFSGGPAQAREAYLTGGSRTFKVVIPVLYIALGIAVPAVVIADRGQSEGATGKLKNKPVSGDLAKGKAVFEESCASCHTLAAVNARGVQGPDLDDIGKVTPDRIVSAIKVGGTGKQRMPAELLAGKEAKDVAAYVSAVAGQ
jgi:mono/diheme cytochrome c family protein